MFRQLLYFLNDRLEYILCGTTFAIFIVLTLLQVLFRFILNFSLSWTEELAKYAFIYMVYFAVSLAVIRHRHVRVEIIDLFIAQKYLKYFYIFTDIVACLFLLLIGWYSIEVMQDFLNMKQNTPALQLPIGWIYVIIPAGYSLAAFRYMQTVFRRFFSKNTEILDGNFCCHDGYFFSNDFFGYSYSYLYRYCHYRGTPAKRYFIGVNCAVELFKSR
jgi:TRAP-type C4-dicarboxylate transport system permease small subunit